MNAKKLKFIILGILLTTAPLSVTAEEPEKPAPAAGSQVLGKGGSMGKSYQQNIVGPGQGAPEYRGAAAGANSEQEKPLEGQPADNANAQKERVQLETQPQTQNQEEVRSRKARDGSGYGAGPGGERGLGSDDAPHHKQHGSSSKGAGK